jgi:hypothetical protein
MDVGGDAIVGVFAVESDVPALMARLRRGSQRLKQAGVHKI